MIYSQATFLGFLFRAETSSGLIWERRWRMPRLSGIAGVLLVMAALAAAQTTGNTAEPIATSQPEIRAVLDAQVAAWNRGDLKAYMQGYWHSPELTFFAGDKESAGWEAAYQRYRLAYQGKDREMGKLNFSNVRIEILNGDAAFVRGSWQLTMKDGSRRNGLFTIVLRKFSEGWRVVHDHSS